MNDFVFDENVITQIRNKHDFSYASGERQTSADILKSAISDDNEPNKTIEFFKTKLINSFIENDTEYELELINENQFKLNDSILKSKYTNINTKLGYFGYDI